MVTAFPNTSEADGGKPGKAKGLMKASEVSKRLEKHLAQTAEEGGELSEEIAEAKAELVELLGGLLTKQAERQLQRLDRYWLNVHRRKCWQQFKGLRTKQKEAS